MPEEEKNRETPTIDTATMNANKKNWYRVLGIAEPMMSALATSAQLSSNADQNFSDSAQRLSTSIMETAKALQKEKIPEYVTTKVAAPICAASWKMQVELNPDKMPTIDVEKIVKIIVAFNSAMGDAEFPVKELSQVAEKLLSDPTAPLIIGTNFREGLYGMAGLPILKELQDQEEKNSENELSGSHAYFMSKMAGFKPERIGSLLQVTSAYMNPADDKERGISGWHTLAFWGDSAEDARAKEMLTLALATQIGMSDDWYIQSAKKNEALTNVLLKRINDGKEDEPARKINVRRTAIAARQYADRIETLSRTDLNDPEKIASVMCTAMRECTQSVQETRARIFSGTDRMLSKKYPQAKTESDILKAIEKEGLLLHIREAYATAKNIREGILAGMDERSSPMEMSIRMKNRAAFLKGIEPLFKHTNARLLESAFPVIGKNQPKTNDPRDEACIIVAQWGESAIRELSTVTVNNIQIPDSDRDRKPLRGRIENVLQEVVRNTDVVNRCVKAGKPDRIFPEIVSEMRKAIETMASMLPEESFKAIEVPLKKELESSEQAIVNAFKIVAEKPHYMENQEAKASQEKKMNNHEQNMENSD